MRYYTVVHFNIKTKVIIQRYGVFFTTIIKQVLSAHIYKNAIVRGFATILTRHFGAICICSRMVFSIS